MWSYSGEGSPEICHGYCADPGRQVRALRVLVAADELLDNLCWLLLDLYEMPTSPSPALENADVTGLRRSPSEPRGPQPGCRAAPPGAPGERRVRRRVPASIMPPRKRFETVLAHQLAWPT